MDITVKLLIKEENIDNMTPTYLATNICRGFYYPEEEQTLETDKMQTSSAQLSTMYTIYKIT